MAKSKRKWQGYATLDSLKGRPQVRVLGIARVSTDKQAKYGESLDSQRDAIRHWVQVKQTVHEPQEWHLVDVLIEGEDNGIRRGRSGTTRAKRDCLAQALRMARQGEVDVVVATKLDRVARNVRDYVDISGEFNEANVALVVFDLDIDTSTPDGQMIMRFFASLAQWQADRISQYSYETTLRHLRQGRPLGPPPVGYTMGDETYVVDERYADHLRLIDRLYLETESTDRVVQMLADRGYTTRRGKTYSKPVVHAILRNCRYAGRQEYEGESYEGNWPPLRDPKTHELIQRVLDSNCRSRHSPKQERKRYSYLFQGLLKCPCCKHSMTPRPGTGRGGTEYPYYVCTRALKTAGRECKLVYLPAKSVDEVLIEYLRGLQFQPEVVSRVIAGANAEAAKSLGTIDLDVERVGSRLVQVRRQMSNIVDVLAEQGTQTPPSVKQKLEGLTADELKLEAEMEVLKERASRQRHNMTTAEEQIATLALFDDFVRLYEDQPERIKGLIPKFVNFVVWHPGDETTGEGRFDINLFGRPFLRDEDNPTAWEEAMAELDRHYRESTNRTVGQNVAGSLGSKIWGG